MTNPTDAAQRLATRLVHAGERAPAPPATPTATPIYTSATYLYPSLAALDAAFEQGDGYIYTRYGNPTVAALEHAVSTIEGGVGAVAFASGMAALHAAVMAAGTPRGETAPRPRGILIARDIYGSTSVLLREFFAAGGIPVEACDMCDLAAVDAAIAALQPDVIVVEQLSNPLLRVVDIAALAQRARTNGARLVVDNTIATPLLQRPLSLGADLVVHSATKYFSGHGDAAGGIVVARSSLLRDTLVRQGRLLGASLGPFEAQQILRGIKTLALRVERQCANAATIAAWLEQHPAVALVRYPGLPSHPQHQHAAEWFGGTFGALVTFDLQAANRTALGRFFDTLRLILPATTLGDIYTLASAPAIASHRELTADQRAARGISDGTVRLSIGIEAVEDLINDLQAALAATGEC
ncbi:MAG TPA: PLP-dependent aspartate aminotransferase family protein [Roseiflexaceae bacterium]|nr:PLP-dependent aspartate aminotransferase family protein [Roseiflexaceae bacterium]